MIPALRRHRGISECKASLVYPWILGQPGLHTRTLPTVISYFTIFNDSYLYDCVYVSARRSEKSDPQDGVTLHVSHPGWVLGTKLTPLQEQYTLLTSELALQPEPLFQIKCSWVRRYTHAAPTVQELKRKDRLSPRIKKTAWATHWTPSQTANQMPCATVLHKAVQPH